MVGIVGDEDGGKQRVFFKQNRKKIAGMIIIDVDFPEGEE